MDGEDERQDLGEAHLELAGSEELATYLGTRELRVKRTSVVLVRLPVPAVAAVRAAAPDVAAGVRAIERFEAKAPALQARVRAAQDEVASLARDADRARGVGLTMLRHVAVSNQMAGRREFSSKDVALTLGSRAEVASRLSS